MQSNFSAKPEATPEAELFVGLKRGVTRAEFERKTDRCWQACRQGAGKIRDQGQSGW